MPKYAEPAFGTERIKPLRTREILARLGWSWTSGGLTELGTGNLARMSLAIREREVVSVLLADGWHEVEPGSFFIDAYEYIHDDGSLSAGGIGVGFHAEDLERGEMAGPLSSVIAVRIVR